MANTAFGLFVLSDIEKANIIVALEDREDDLKAEIADNEAADWSESAARNREDLASVQGLLRRLGAR